MEHGVVKCAHCDGVIRRCLCINHAEQVRYEVCAECDRMDKPVQIVDIPDHTTNIQRQAVSMFDNLLDQAIKGELVEAMVVTKNPDGSYTTHFTDEFKNRAERVGGLEMLKHEVMIDYNEEG